MQGPGQSLRQAREAHGRTLEEMSEATGIRLPFLTALEQEAFDSLPGRGFGKLYIRAYAEVLGFDPRPVIEAYDRVVREMDASESASESPDAPRPVSSALAAWRKELMARRAESSASGEPEEETFDQDEALEDESAPEPGSIPLPHPAETATPSRPALTRPWLVAALLLLVLLPITAALIFRTSTPDTPPMAARHEPVPGRAIAPPAALPEPPRTVEVPLIPPGAPSPAREPVATSLQVAESGIGLRFTGTRLEGESDRFRSGQRVTFATRVLGGEAGEHIRHVWLRDGKVEQSIRLRLGGASWRTYSTKTLGRPGAWAVEARDEQGRVLARADLTVAP